MPAAPEVPHGAGGIGVLEVPGQPEAQHLPYADGHPGIAAEVQIQLQGVGHKAQPRHRGGDALEADGLDLTPQAADLVGQQHLHGKADDEVPQARIQLPQGAGAAVHLRFQLRRVHERAGEELGEHQDLCGVGHRTLLRLHPATVHVDDVGGHLEGVKAQAQRQGDATAQQAGIFEAEKAQAQHQQVPHQQGLAPRQLPAGEPRQSHEPQQQRQTPRPLPCTEQVKDKTP